MMFGRVINVLAAYVGVVAASNVFLPSRDFVHQVADQKLPDSPSAASFLHISELDKDKMEAVKGAKAKAKAKSKAKAKANTVSNLPDVSQVMNKPTQVFEALSSRVSTLTARLDELEKEGAATIRSDKKEYESKLKAQKGANAAIEQANTELTKQIYSLMDSNKQLRLQAVNLQTSSARLTADLQSLRANISAAQEFADLALTDSEGLSNAQELTVLGELAEQDAAAENVRVHENHLAEISATKLAMFQKMRNAKKLSMLQAGESSINDIDDKLLQTLASALDDFTTEQNASRASLKESFDVEFRAGEQRHEELLEEQAELYKKRDAAFELQGRLTAAVKHLEETYEILHEKSLALRSFAERLAKRPMPSSK